MTYEAGVLLALVALLLGVALGRYLGTRQLEQGQASVSASSPMPEVLPAIRVRYLSELRPVAAAALEARDGYPPSEGEVERLAMALSGVAADAWARGVTELREALVLDSGLGAELVDYATTTAIASLEQRRV